MEISKGPFDKKSCGIVILMESGNRNFYQEALRALKTSTTLLTVAESLVEAGNFSEADRLRIEAKRQRNISVRLIEKANITELANHAPRVSTQGKPLDIQQLRHQRRH
jgi:hypothetical protein